MLKLYTKKSTLNMTEFASLKKLTRKSSSWKEIFSSGMSLTCPDLYRLIFQTFYHNSLISPKQEIDETVNFRNFRKLFTNKFSAFWWHSGIPFSNGKNERSDKAQEICCNGCHLYTLGKLIDLSATR